jgi:hypothetical protein
LTFVDVEDAVDQSNENFAKEDSGQCPLFQPPAVIGRVKPMISWSFMFKHQKKFYMLGNFLIRDLQGEKHAVVKFYLFHA